jgi:hypothetical protein
MNYAVMKYGEYNTAHEHASVLREEIEEHWQHVKDDTADSPDAIYELIQVAAVALRYAIEHGCVEIVAEVQKKRHER